MITFENFKTMALSLMREGAKVCPCCLHTELNFTVTDDDEFFILACQACDIQVSSQTARLVKKKWNRRALPDPRINAITYDISCEYFDKETCKIHKINHDGTIKEVASFDDDPEEEEE